MALYIFKKGGAGLPLHKLERVQDALRTNEDPGWDLSRICAMGSTAPWLRTKSLTLWLSPAMFPMPQIACSTTSMCWELNNWIKDLMVPFSISTWTCSGVPEARLVRHHAASNYIIFIRLMRINKNERRLLKIRQKNKLLLTWSLGKSNLKRRFKRRGTRLESMTC